KAPEVPSTHHDWVTCRAGGRSSQPNAPARPSPNTVRYTRIPAIHANRIPITKRCASDMRGIRLDWNRHRTVTGGRPPIAEYRPVAARHLLSRPRRVGAAWWKRKLPFTDSPDVP